MYWGEYGAAMTTRDGKTNPGAKIEHKQTLREAAAFSKVRKAQAEQAPRVKAVKGEVGSSLMSDHPDNMTGHILLMEALGTADFDFFNALLGQLANASSASGEVDEQGESISCSRSSRASNPAIRLKRCSEPKWQRSTQRP